MSSKISPSFIGIIRNGKLDFSQAEKDNLQLWIESFDDGVELEVQISKLASQRTLKQNAALHKYCELVANSLNESGLTIEKVIKSFTMEHNWSPGLVKELLWREAQKFAVGKQSTTELEKTQEIDAVYNVVNRFLAKLGVESIPFPANELRIKE